MHRSANKMMQFSFLFLQKETLRGYCSKNSKPNEIPMKYAHWQLRVTQVLKVVCLVIIELVGQREWMFEVKQFWFLLHLKKMLWSNTCMPEMFQ